jgi:4-hydroxythreonine-4-phosphate dehydrogenase
MPSVSPSPVIALTLGEPAGIAPEITAKAWLALREPDDARFFLIGDMVQYKRRAREAGLAIDFVEITSAPEAHACFVSALPVLHRPLARHSVAGQLEPQNAAGVIAAVDEAVALCLAGQAGAIVTNPIQKETLYGAGFKFQGHTDYLGHLARQHGHKAHDVMMLVADGLRTVPVTIHIPLSKVISTLTTDEIVAQGRIVDAALRTYFGIASPRIAVTGVNPHAGENGTMGHEEATIVSPAITLLKADGLNVFGPLPADTAFHAQARSNYDAILCMYHDQALIPVKTLDFHGGVNVTLGLPFIRTSPDHGTALGIAGTGQANAASLIAALRLAQRMAQQRTAR